MNRTVWFNVTTSMHWQRPAVGIVRVEQELRKRLEQELGEAFKTCFWDGEKFVECNGITEAVVSMAVTEKLPKSTSNIPEYLLPQISKRVALKNLAQSIFWLSPSWSRNLIDRFLRWVKPKVIRIINNALQRREIRNADLFSGNAEISTLRGREEKQIFQPGDLFISVGLDWNYGFQKFVNSVKNYGVVTVGCCYDLIPVNYPQYCSGDVSKFFSDYFTKLSICSDLILCISKSTKKDLHNFIDATGLNQVKTKVIHLGGEIKGGEDEISKTVNDILSDDFILFVSSIERRKNHEVLYRAYHLLCAEGKKEYLPKLVFVGMKGWGVEDLMKDINLDPLTEGLIYQFNHVNDTELNLLYKSSKFVVYPSLYEGWGLPVAEALSLGKFVLCSNRASLPEVGGELVEYLDPWNPTQWAEKIIWYVQNPEELDKRESKVRDEYQPIKWEDTSREVINAVVGLTK